MRERGFPKPTHPGLGFWTREQIDRWIQGADTVSQPVEVESEPSPAVADEPPATVEVPNGVRRPEPLFLLNLKRRGRGGG
jgi:hypothetical protein